MEKKIITMTVLRGESLSHENFPGKDHLLVLKGHMVIISNGRIILHIHQAETGDFKERKEYTATAVEDSEVMIF